MMLVTGPAFSGKRAYVSELMGWSAEELDQHAVWDVQDLVGNADLDALAAELAIHDVVIACELGGGVVPIDADQREKREQAGRLACLLAQRADCVVRVCCGLPQVLKGETPRLKGETP